MRVVAAGVCALLVVGTSLVAGASAAGRAATPGAAAPRISGPYVYENLDVYLVHGGDRTSGRKLVPLAQALAEGKVIVRETGNVSSLTVENLSDQEVYVQAGEIVKGGRQDRVLAVDLVLGFGSLHCLLR